MTTVLCGSLSLHPSSLGSSMHRAAYEALGLDFAYVPFKISDLPGALVGMRALGIRGFGVSMPYKVEVLSYLDALDPLAERIGAVNTIVHDAGRLTGYNTDAIGARRALEEHLELPGKRVVVVGAGGAARAVAFALAEAGCRLCLVNRTPERAEALAAAVTASLPESTVETCRLDAPPPIADVLVNASAGGMGAVSNDAPVPAAWLENPGLVMDIVYKPLDTVLLSTARSKGKMTIHGGRMLLHQAAAQFELYTQRPAPRAVMDQALRKALGEA